MKIEIYRKRHVFNACVIDDEPETVFNNVSMLSIGEKYFSGAIDGEELTIKKDNVNYHYVIVA